MYSDEQAEMRNTKKKWDSICDYLIGQSTTKIDFHLMWTNEVIAN